MHIPDSLALIEKVRRMESRLEELDAMLNLAVEQFLNLSFSASRARRRAAACLMSSPQPSSMVHSPRSLRSSQSLWISSSCLARASVSGVMLESLR